MRIIMVIGLAVWLLLCLACEPPFKTKETPDDNLMHLAIDYDGGRITESLQIGLSWADLTVEYLESLRIR